VNPFVFPFMQRALVAAALVGLAAPAVGIFLVQRRLSLMGDGIGHVAFMGVGAALLLGTSPVVTAICVAAIGGLLIEALRQRGRTAGDVALALIFYGGLAGGFLLTQRAGAGVNALAFLFGSLLSVTDLDLVVVAVLAATVLGLTFLLRKELFAVSYDEEVAQVSGLPVRALNFLVALLAALTVGLAMRVVGLLLVAAMLVLPVATVQQLTRSWRATVASSLVAGTAVSVGGLVAAFYANVAPGAAIVLTAIGAFALAAAVGAAGPRRRSRTLE
jgi:zinc transport system permease protein